VHKTEKEVKGKKTRGKKKKGKRQYKDGLSWRGLRLRENAPRVVMEMWVSYRPKEGGKYILGVDIGVESKGHKLNKIMS